MEKIQVEIKPGTGLGNLKFGMTREEVKAILGEPDHSETTHYGDDVDDRSDAWEYHPLRLDLSFEEAEDWRLTIISVSSEDYQLKGSSLIGLSQEELMDELDLLKINNLAIEDLSTEDNPDQILIASDELGLNFWVYQDVLEEIQWGPQFVDEHTIKWPE